MSALRRILLAVAVGAALSPSGAVSAAPARPHNVIVFVADGLRSGIVTSATAPAMAAVRAEGVDFRNSHSLFPTVTTANASAIATGHYLGDTGDFANDLYVGAEPIGAPVNSRFAPVENDASIARLNERYGGNYLNEDSLLATARKAGFSTAALGKVGPTLVQDVTAQSGLGTIIIDGSYGRDAQAGAPSVAPDIGSAIAAAGLAPVAPAAVAPAAAGQPAHALAGDQVRWMAGVATKVVLPRFKRARKPFIMVFWSLDPDGSQHNQADGPGALVPGINGPTSMAGIRAASDALQALRDTVKALGLESTTDILVTADHGFATVGRESATSATLKIDYPDTPKGKLPSTFVAVDLALALDLPLWNRDGKRLEPLKGERPPSGAFLGADPSRPDIVVGPAAQLIYFAGADPKAMARRTVAALSVQDYTGALFLNDDLGPAPGALPMSAVNLMGSARTLRPGLMLSMASGTTGCPVADTCETIVAEGRPTGQGTHGTLGRGETHNFMAAVGPDFKRGFVDPSPVSNADLAWTIARITGLKLQPKGKLVGRPLTEALKGGAPVRTVSRRLVSEATADGFRTVLDYQTVGGVKYFDAAGMPGRVFGLKP